MWPALCLLLENAQKRNEGKKEGEREGGSKKGRNLAIMTPPLTKLIGTDNSRFDKHYFNLYCVLGAAVGTFPYAFGCFYYFELQSGGYLLKLLWKTKHRDFAIRLFRFIASLC